MLGRFTRPVKVERGLPFHMPVTPGAHVLTVMRSAWKRVLGALLVALPFLDVLTRLPSANMAQGSPAEPSSLLLDLVSYGASAALFVLGLHWLVSRLDVTITGATDYVSQRGLFGRRTFTDPLSAYQGIRHREYRTWEPQVPTRLNLFRRFIVQRLELEHPDSKRTIPLMQARTEELPRKDLEDYAKAFGLPAIQNDGEDILVRAAEDLDTPIAELARKGKTKGAQGPERPPPRSVRVRPSDDQIEI